MSVASVGYIPVSPMPRPDVQRVQSVRQDAAVNQPEPKKAKPQIHSTAADLEQIGLVFNKKLRFEVDHASNEVIVKVIDKETDKVIKELPPEELQRLHSNLKETIGILFDERV
uniref:Putative flagellin FlaG n=1 Tax=uncultured bacterium contig00030 TaxID=1181519 RepID=A0A806K0S9_9BACT|nr:putative flagellin FlaG [uncultured bacterium contig00030]